MDDLRQLTIAAILAMKRLVKAPPHQTNPVDAKEAGEAKIVGLYPGEKLIQTTQLPNGLYHHIASTTYNFGDTKHTISQNKDPNADALSQVYVKRINDGRLAGYNHVVYSASRPEVRGLGLGRQAYIAALQHHGNLSSGLDVSQAANKVWEWMGTLPELQTHLGVYHGDPVHPQGIKDDVHYTVAKDRKSLQRHFTPVNIPNLPPQTGNEGFGDTKGAGYIEKPESELERDIARSYSGK